MTESRPWLPAGGAEGRRDCTGHQETFGEGFTSANAYQIVYFNM